jgi:hypothetical protein
MEKYHFGSFRLFIPQKLPLYFYGFIIKAIDLSVESRTNMFLISRYELTEGKHNSSLFG